MYATKHIVSKTIVRLQILTVNLINCSQNILRIYSLYLETQQYGKAVVL